MGEYSMLSYGAKPGPYSGPAICEKQAKKRKKESKKLTADTSVDQLNAQVDKKKKKDGDTTHPHPPEDDTSVDQLYAQVDKKKKKDGDTTHPHPPEADTPVDQLYAQVNKKKKKDGDTTYRGGHISGSAIRSSGQEGERWRYHSPPPTRG